MNGWFIKGIAKEVDKMNDIADENWPKGDERFAYFLFGVIEIIFIFGNLLLFGYIFDPSTYLTLLVISFGVYCAGSLLYLLNKVNNDTNDNLKFILFFCFHHIMIFLLSFYLTLKIMPYRGHDPMKLRRVKLKKLIRKSKFNKLKFWK